VSSQAAITRPVLPSGSIELLTADSILKRVSGSDGILVQDALHVQDGVTPYLLVSLDSGTLGRLTSLERRYVAQLGPYQTGSTNANSTFTAGHYVTTHTVPFPSGRFSSAPMVFLQQGAPSNSSGHSSFTRCWTMSVSATQCTIVLSDDLASNNVYLYLLAIQP